MLFVITRLGGVVGQNLQKTENLIALPSGRALKLENFNRDQNCIGRQRSVLPFFAEFIRRNPTAWRWVAQARIHFAASPGITLMPEMDQIRRQLVLFFLRQFRQFSFEFVQTHGFNLHDAKHSSNRKLALSKEHQTGTTGKMQVGSGLEFVVDVDIIRPWKITGLRRSAMA
jgi:hypothetical protein